MKILGCLSAIALLAAMAGCTETKRTGGLQAALVNSMTSGPNAYSNQAAAAAQTAGNTPNVTNVLSAVNTVNGAPQTASGTVNNSLTPANIMTAVQAALASNAAKQAAAQNPVGLGPGPAFGPGAFTSDNVMIGPAPFKVSGYGNN